MNELFKKPTPGEGVEAEKPAINPGLAQVIVTVISLASPLINRIKNEYAKEQLLNFTTPLKEAILALSDANPDDPAQIKNILLRFFQASSFTSETKNELLAIINREVEDEDVRVLVGFIISWAFDMIPILLDEVKPNTGQIKEYFLAKLQGPDGGAFIKALLGLLIKDSEVVEWVSKLIHELATGALNIKK